MMNSTQEAINAAITAGTEEVITPFSITSTAEAQLEYDGANGVTSAAILNPRSEYAENHLAMLARTLA